MNNEQPTQPITDERLAEIRNHVDHQLMVDRSVNTIAIRNLAQAVDDRADLLAEVDRLRAELDALRRNEQTVTDQSCGDASIWSCALGDHCVCKKTNHGGRHECACGSWWFRDK